MSTDFYWSSSLLRSYYHVIINKQFSQMCSVSCYSVSLGKCVVILAVLLYTLMYALKYQTKPVYTRIEVVHPVCFFLGLSVSQVISKQIHVNRTEV